MHLALIMDGNRRWAKNQGLIKLLGHTKGGDNIEPTLRLCMKEWIECVSFWALAKKNLEERSQEELGHMYDLMRDRFPKLTPTLVEEWVRFNFVGDETLLPDDIRDLLHRTREITKSGTRLDFLIAIWYGWQYEIISGIKNYIRKNIDKLTPENIENLLSGLNEKNFSEYLDTGRFPTPDLIVRTGGDIRHSGYWLYGSEYSEYYFTKKLWPEFDETEFYKALNSLKSAKRNFGK